MPRAEQQPWWRRSGGSCSRVRPKPGFSCNADGSRLPLGPNVEFKVIDYGCAKLLALVIEHEVIAIAVWMPFRESLLQLAYRPSTSTGERPFGVGCLRRGLP